MRDRAATSRVEVTDRDVPTTVYRWARRRENLSLVLIDIGVVTAAWLLALAAGFEADVPSDVVDRALLVIGPPIVMQIVIHWAAGLYGPVWRYASIEEAVRVMAAVAAGMLAAFGWFWAARRHHDTDAAAPHCPTGGRAAHPHRLRRRALPVPALRTRAAAHAGGEIGAER